MRIAHLVHGLGPGGAQRVVAALARELAHHHHTVFTPALGAMSTELEQAGAAIRVVPQRRRRLDPARVAALRTELLSQRFDLVHCHLFGDTLHGVLAVRRTPLAIVSTLHNERTQFKPLQRLAYRVLLPRCRRVIACSEAVARSFHRLVPGDLLLTVPNGAAPPRQVDPRAGAALRAAFGLAAGRPVVAAGGRLEREKDFALLLRALALLTGDEGVSPQKPPALVLFGDGSQRQTLATLAARLDIDQHVVFAGFRADARQLVAGADVVAVSSRHEGLPLVVLEAMAAGRCIVTTAVPGVIEAVRAEQEALVAPIGDAAAFARALARALADGVLRSRLGEAARRRFFERYTAQRMAAGYDAVYRQLQAEAAAPPS